MHSEYNACCASNEASASSVSMHLVHLEYLVNLVCC